MTITELELFIFGLIMVFLGFVFGYFIGKTRGVIGKKTSIILEQDKIIEQLEREKDEAVSRYWDLVHKYEEEKINERFNHQHEQGNATGPDGTDEGRG